jgi:hypothetical protein
MGKSHKATQPAQRNAYALPAKMRQNAGAHNHKHPPRLHVVLAIGNCRWCGAPLDPEDDSQICFTCDMQDADD